MIYQLKDPLIQNVFGDYITDNCPEKFTGKLDYLVWGKSANLWSLFTDVDTDKKYKFSTFYNNDYAPKKNGVSLRSIDSGKICILQTQLKNNRVKLIDINETKCL